jgi:uncharacterized RDD family membrane protein YckC
MSRLIRNPRAQELQGSRAGVASRSLAFGADIGVAFLIYVVIGAVVGILWDLFFSSKLSIPRPSGWFSAGAIFWILVVYLALGWGSTGRTIGKQVMGLRVVRADGRSLKPRQAFVRALFCAVLYPGLLLALVDRRNRSLQDVVCKTVVVYDWIPESGRPRVIPKQVVSPSA